jgi:hypothetical protein
VIALSRLIAVISLWVPISISAWQEERDPQGREHGRRGGDPMRRRPGCTSSSFMGARFALSRSA